MFAMFAPTRVYFFGEKNFDVIKMHSTHRDILTVHFNILCV